MRKLHITSGLGVRGQMSGWSMIHFIQENCSKCEAYNTDVDSCSLGSWETLLLPNPSFKRCTNWLTA